MKIVGTLATGLVVSLASSCFLFVAREATAPPRLVFPLVEKNRVVYDGKIVGALRQDGGRVYLTTEKRLVYCIEVKNSSILWSHALESDLEVSPVVGKDSLFLLDREGTLTCLSKSGQLLWKSKTGATPPVSLSLGSGLLIVGGEAGDILALEPASGMSLWGYKAGGAIPGGAVFWGNEVICASLDGKIYFLSRAGRLVRTLVVGSPLPVQPLVDEDRIYVGAEGAHFYCFDLRRQKRKWRMDLRGKVMAPPRLDGKRLFVSSSNCVLYCLNKDHGDILWWQPLPSRSPYELAFCDGRILVTSLSSTLFCLDKTTGEEVGSYEAGSEIRSNPVWLEPNVLINLYDPAQEKGNLVILQGKEETGPAPVREGAGQATENFAIKELEK